MSLTWTIYTVVTECWVFSVPICRVYIRNGTNLSLVYIIGEMRRTLQDCFTSVSNTEWENTLPNLLVRHTTLLCLVGCYTYLNNLPLQKGLVDPHNFDVSRSGKHAVNEALLSNLVYNVLIERSILLYMYSILEPMHAPTWLRNWSPVAKLDTPMRNLS